MSKLINFEQNSATSSEELYSKISEQYDSYIAEQDYKFSGYDDKAIDIHLQALEESQKKYQTLLIQVQSQNQGHQEIIEAVSKKLQLISNLFIELQQLKEKISVTLNTSGDLSSPEEKESKQSEEVIHDPEFVRAHHEELLGNFKILIGNKKNGPHEDFKAADYLEKNAIKNPGPEGLLYFLDHEDKNTIALYKTALDHNLPLSAMRVIEACLDCEMYKNPDAKPNPDELLPFILNKFLPLKNQAGQTLEEICVIRNIPGGKTGFFAQRIGMLKSQIDADLFEVSSVVKTQPALTVAPVDEKQNTKNRSNTLFDMFRRSSFTPSLRRSSNPQPVKHQSTTGFFATRRHERALTREHSYAEKLNILEAQAKMQFTGFSLRELTKTYSKLSEMNIYFGQKIEKYQRDPIKYNPSKYNGIIKEYTAFQERINKLKPSVSKVKSRSESMNMTRTPAYTNVLESTTTISKK